MSGRKTNCTVQKYFSLELLGSNFESRTAVWKSVKSQVRNMLIFHPLDTSDPPIDHIFHPENPAVRLDASSISPNTPHMTRKIPVLLFSREQRLRHIGVWTVRNSQTSDDDVLSGQGHVCVCPVSSPPPLCPTLFPQFGGMIASEHRVLLL